MLKKLMPAVLALGGLGGGLGAGLLLRPAAGDHAAGAAVEGEHATEMPIEEGGAEHASEAAPEAAADEHAEATLEYVEMSNQFVIPVVQDGKVVSMVVLALSLEGKVGSSDLIYAREPKLRDAFLQLLFDHANSGGFKGSFTDGANLILLRRALLEQAQRVMPDQITDVLISDIARQDS